MRIAPHTEVRADPIEEYEAAHRKVPEATYRRHPRRGGA